MLVLARRIDESLRIGDDILLTVLRFKGSTVRIGVDAPRDVLVDRGEVSVRRRKEQERSNPRATDTDPDIAQE